MVRPSASVGIGIALFLGCAKPAEPLAAGPAPRVARAVDQLGALATHVARCTSVLVVWIPATNLSLPVEMEEALVGKTGARLREKAIVAPSL